MANKTTAQIRADRANAGRIGAYVTHSRHDVRETTKAGRQAFLQRFIDEVDPDRTLPEAERTRRKPSPRRRRTSPPRNEVCYGARRRASPAGDETSGYRRLQRASTATGYATTARKRRHHLVVLPRSRRRDESWEEKGKVGPAVPFLSTRRSGSNASPAARKDADGLKTSASTCSANRRATGRGQSPASGIIEPCPDWPTQTKKNRAFGPTPKLAGTVGRRHSFVRSRLVATYEYKDQDGKVIAIKGRWKSGEDNQPSSRRRLLEDVSLVAAGHINCIGPGRRWPKAPRDAPVGRRTGFNGEINR